MKIQIQLNAEEVAALVALATELEMHPERVVYWIVSQRLVVRRSIAEVPGIVVHEPTKRRRGAAFDRRGTDPRFCKPYDKMMKR